MAKLTEKQRRFIDYYIETGNATESAILAGYSKKTAKQIGNENLTKLDFFVKQKLDEKESERIASQDEVLQFLTNVLRGEEEEEILMPLDGKIKKVKKKPSIRDKLKSAEQLAKRYGLDRAEPEDKNERITSDIIKAVGDID